jgi:mRNA interferase RelE/StbE
MIGFTIIYANSVVKFIKKLSKRTQKRIIQKLELLTINPRLVDIVKMKGYKDTYRIRIGKYRVLIVVDFSRKIIKVVRINLRSKIERFYSIF